MSGDSLKVSDLTPAEVTLILERRAKAERAASIKKYTLFMLEQAYQYEKWLQKEGHEDSFSTWLEKFEFEGKYPGGPSMGTIHDLVNHIRHTAAQDVEETM